MGSLLKCGDEKELKRRLDRLYLRFARKDRTAGDPVEFPHRYSRPEDIEAAGLIAASFAYGRVDLFKPVIGRVLELLGPRPYRGLVRLDIDAVKESLGALKYRFNRTEDIAAYLVLLSQAVGRHGSLGGIFFRAPAACPDTARTSLSLFVREILAGDTSPVYGGDKRPPGLLQLLPDTARGAASKRMYMFLRWMVRRDEVDFGIWRGFGTQNLVIPLDTHVARISRRLGLTARKSPDYRMAVEVTGSLRSLDPDDPVKYDFALAHLGISGECPARPSAERCKGCDLERLCIKK